ncbi:putative nucleotidyltransferase, ribonuclease H [Tanacetum coccineum]
MQEMLYKFIDEGKREHEEMREFILMNNVQVIDYEVKGVTTRGGKTTTQDVHDNNADEQPEDPLVIDPNQLGGSNEVLTENQPQKTNKPFFQPSSEVQTPPVPFLRRLRKEKDKAQQKKFLENLKQLHINLTFIEALAQMPKYAKFLKRLLANKARLEEACKITKNKRCSAVLLNKLPSKEKDPGSFTIPYDIGQLHIDNALANLGASISLMPYTMYKKLGFGEPKATRISLELADRSIQYPRGIIENVLIKVDKVILPIDFVILDMHEDSRIPIILGRPFLATARAMIDVFNKKITLKVGDDEVIFYVDQSIKRPTTEDEECYGIDDLDDTINEESQELLANEEHVLFLSRKLEKTINQSDLEYYESDDRNNDDDSDSKNPIRRINSVNAPAIEIDEKKPELKNLPQHLEYAYLHGGKSFPVIISSKLSKKEKMSLLQVLEKHKGAIAWKMSDIKGISPSYYTHKILMEDDYKLVIQPQRHLNPKVQDVGGMTVVLNDNNQLIPSRIVIGWRVFIDYHKLNDATRKDHFPLPFIDQILERLCGNEYYCFLDGFSGFFQIPIASEDQEKTCNAPATFQRCMTAIVYDMVEDFMEVFMDDFLVFGNSFDYCLANLDRMLSRCEEPNLVLNWEKCHFMVKEGIVLGHKISSAGIKVDRAKIDVIAKLPYPTDVKGVRSFLGHAGFYQSKQDAKRRLIRWVLLLQGFDIEIKNKKGAKNLAADHLSRLESPNLGTFTEEEITDEFPNEHLLILKAELNSDEPCASITGRKVYESRFYWPNIFKDAKDYVMRCDAYQRSGNISSRSEMPQNNIQWDTTRRIGQKSLMMHCGHSELPTRHLLDAPPSDWFMEKLVTYL